MVSRPAKSRGEVAPGKRQVNWRVREDLLVKMEAEAKEKGFVDANGKESKPRLLEFILTSRYYPNRPRKEKA